MNSEPLSHELARILRQKGAEGELTLNGVLAQTSEGRGVFLLLILLCLPFVALVSIPGMSTPLGLAIAGLALRHALGKPPRLPQRLGGRGLSRKVTTAILENGLKVLRLVERVVKPRQTSWMAWPAARMVNSAVVVYAAFLLALPLPPIPPFTNAFPSYAIILVAASMMEQDGVMVWAGYAATLGTTVYFLWWGELIAAHFAGWAHQAALWLRLSA